MVWYGGVEGEAPIVLIVILAGRAEAPPALARHHHRRRQLVLLQTNGRPSPALTMARLFRIQE